MAEIMAKWIAGKNHHAATATGRSDRADGAGGRASDDQHLKRF